jgi:flagellar hook assembly protein FlgD
MTFCLPDISFRLAERTRASLVIYNILGEKVKTLVNREMGAGTHTVHWDGKDQAGDPAASGVHFYRLKTESFDQTKKMLLMK